MAEPREPEFEFAEPVPAALPVAVKFAQRVECDTLLAVPAREPGEVHDRRPSVHLAGAELEAQPPVGCEGCAAARDSAGEFAGRVDACRPHGNGVSSGCARWESVTLPYFRLLSTRSTDLPWREGLRSVAWRRPRQVTRPEAAPANPLMKEFGHNDPVLASGHA